MLQVSLWSRVITAIILIVGILFALPNALPENIRNQLPSWLPKETVSLGLDLQGGSYLLLEVELDKVEKDKLESLMSDIRVGLRKARIAFSNLSNKNDVVSVEIRDRQQFAEARKILDDLNPSLSGSILTGGNKEFVVSQAGQTRLSMRLTDEYRTQTKTQTLAQSIEVVRRRIDEMGTREPGIERQGDQRIVVQVPGLSDPQRLIDILGTTAKMTFQLVDETADLNQAMRGIVPIGSILLPQEAAPDQPAPPPIVVQKRVMVSGDRLKNASAGFNSQNSEPVVTFRFDSVGARQFGDVTKANTGRRFAIVLDNKVISAPVIREPILGGSGEISGSFTSKTANDLAVLLRAGALPAPLKVIEQRTVGAELGADSVKAGLNAALAGLALVVLFMFARYGLFGLFANIALTFNVVLLFAALNIFGATLTLPGIAGIVLTIGMAVDANVLIYERMREEKRNGRSVIAALDTGFQRAMATIIDANMTHLIAAVVLFQLGSGPVRGFAVTLGLGIITSFFTAVMVTRLIVIWWLRWRKPKELII